MVDTKIPQDNGSGAGSLHLAKDLYPNRFICYHIYIPKENESAW